MKRSPECIYCQVIDRQQPSKVQFENDEFIVIHDIHPLAPVHLLVIPKEHILRSMAELEVSQEGMIGRMMTVAKQVAEDAGIAAEGYRLVFNVRHHAGQEVDHLHLHILGGQPLGPLG